MSHEEYAAALARTARAMASSKFDEMALAIDAKSDPSMVKFFVEGNDEKRQDKLSDQLEFLRDAFDQLDQLIQQYTVQVPLAAYDTGASDAVRVLDWINQNQQLSIVQQDYVACQRGRLDVEHQARMHRAQHVRFQKLLSAPTMSLECERFSQDILINPSRSTARFVSSALLDEDDVTPADVFFFAVGGEIATAVLEPDAIEVVETLTAETLNARQWSERIPEVEPDVLLEFCDSLQSIGLVAYDAI